MVNCAYIINSLSYLLVVSGLRNGGKGYANNFYVGRFLRELLNQRIDAIVPNQI